MPTISAPGRHRSWPEPGRWVVPVVLALYLVGGSTLALRYRYAITPDGTAYVDIARDYASGHWADAVNGLWSPLYSWLLAVPLCFGADPVRAGQLIQVLVGATALLGFWTLLRRLGVPPFVVVPCLAAFAVVVLSWAVGGVGPDLLPVALCLPFVRLLLDCGTRRPRVALAGGLVAGVGYLAKASFLPFFVVLLVAVTVLRLSTGGGRRAQLVRFVAAGLGFAILVLPWALLISAKYHHLTFGTSAAYNLAIIGPGHDSLSVAHPQATLGLLPPPNPRATSAWTDPTTIPVPTWSPLSQAGLTHEIRNVGLNSGASVNWLLRYWILSPAVLLWGLSSWWRRTGHGRREEVRILLMATVTLIGVYLPWLVESRYLWSAFALLTVLGAFWWAVRHHGRTVGWLSAGTLAVGMILLVAQPLHHLISADGGASRGPSPVVSALRPLGVGGNIASDDPTAWSDDLYLSYFLGAHYYGTMSPTASDAERARQLREDHIDYFLVHGPTTPSYLTGFAPIARLPGASLTVFRSTK